MASPSRRWKGLSSDPANLHPVAAAFRAEHGLQCGFCTPGMVMATVSLLAENPKPTEREIREGLEGNLCRCTGYHNIVRAVIAASGQDPDTVQGKAIHPATPRRRPQAAWRSRRASPSDRPPPPRPPQPRLPSASGRLVQLQLGWEWRMIPVAFAYERPDTLDGALALLAEHGEDAKVLAGGHSLLPVMKLRLAAPELVIDIGRLAELRYIRVQGEELAIGAGSRHHDVATSEVVAAEVPLLGAVARTVGDPQVRHRGTLGGSLAHADPASDLPAAVLALGGTVVLRGPRGERQVPITEFFTGVFSTAAEPDELIVEVRVPRTSRDRASAGGSSRRWRRAGPTRSSPAGPTTGRSSGVAVVDGRVGLVNMGSTPLRASATEAALAGGASIADAAAVADQGTEPPGDLAATPAYRRHLARVLTRRALTTAAGG